MNEGKIAFMHDIHTTDGLVIYSRPQGEANRLVYVFTKGFGLIVAIAQGIRFEKSKLRYNVQDYTFSTFSLVHGKEFWRIVGASELILGNKSDQKTKQAILSRISQILIRFVQGEEKREDIYECLLNFSVFIDDHTDLKEEVLTTSESLLLIRILYRLGYVGKSQDYNEFILDTHFDPKNIETLITKRADINRIINSSLKESHL